MAAWKERGYVPDSDDEDEEELGLPNQHNLPPRTETAAEKNREQPTSENEGNSIPLHARLHRDVVVGNQEPVAVDNERFCDLTRTGEDSAFLHPAQNERDKKPSKDESNSQNDELPDQDRAQVGDTQATGSLVAEQLRNELQSGLDIVKKILSDASSILDNQSHNPSASSSPLSSANSFSAEEDSWQHLPEETSVESLALDKKSPNKGIAPSLNNGANHVAQLEQWIQLPRRNLRQRNAIQIHPYALEGARYQRELLARGIKPIYVAGSRRHINPDRDARPRDSREGSVSEESTDISSSQQYSSSPLRPISNNEVRQRAPKQSADSAASDEELPDLDAILQGKQPKLTHIKKRLKHLSQTIRDKRDDNDLHMYDLPSDSASLTLGGSADDAIFHVPPSPPPSRAIDSRGNEAFRRSRNHKSFTGHITPQALPTPNTSSEAQFSIELPVQIHEGSDSDDMDVQEGSSSPIPHPASERADSQILQLQRKTKGVLPASFFRLQEQQRQARKTQVRPSPPSPDRIFEGPGVAHRVARRQDLEVSPLRVLHNTIIVSDDSPSEEDYLSEENIDSATLGSPKIYSGMMGLVDGDIEEDNTIDTMPQPHSRKRRLPDATKKRQRRISEFSHVINVLSRTEQARMRRSPKRRKGPVYSGSGLQRQNVKTPKVRIPSLGPLDAPDYANIPRSEQPQFLRVAARRARSSKTSGRRIAGGKFLKLATSADTYDVNTALENWRKGKYQQKSRAPLDPSRRKPRQQHQLAVPHDRPVSGSSNDFESLQSSSRSQSQVERHSPPRQRTEDVIRAIVLRQSGHPDLSLSGSAAIQSVSDPSTPTGPRPIAPLHARQRNRSGKGMLLPSTTDFAKFRDAQFEDLAHVKPRNRILNAFQGRLVVSNGHGLHSAAKDGQGAKAPPPSVAKSGSLALVSDGSSPAFPRPVRKRPPQQAKSTFLDHILRSEALSLEYSTDKEVIDSLSGVVFAGLGSPEFPITQDFGIVPLPGGTYVHESTFVGQGQLSQLIHKLIHQPRKFIQSTGGVVTVNRPSFASTPYHWGVWDEQVSKEFSAWFVELQDCLGLQDPQNIVSSLNPSGNVLAAITSLTAYLSGHVCFQGSQEVTAFAEDANRMARGLVSRIESHLRSRPAAISPDFLQFLYLLLIFIFEVACVLASASSYQKLQMETCSTFKTLALVILKDSFRDDSLAKIKGLTSSDSDGLSVGRDDPKIDALVVVNNLSRQTVLRIDIWELIAEALQSAIGFIPENSVTFKDYDRWWKGVFSILPLLELDETGLIRQRSSSPGWDLIQRLLNRFLSLFMPRRHNTGYSTKYYGRILVLRCFDLVRTWGWQGGHAVAGALFDAYNSNDLDELFGETPDHHFCIRLNLDPSTPIYVDKNDSGFHAFLGLLAQTILNSLKPDADQKLANRVLRSLSARLIPTKGADILRNRIPSFHDITALRNRLDLASVMYCAMPTELKPSIRLFQSFVDFRTAHHQACQLALNCWSRIVHHAVLAEESLAVAGQKASEDHPQRTLLLLREWHDSMIMNLLVEYASTNSEAAGLAEQRPSRHEQHYILSDVRKLIAEVLKEALKASEQSFEFCRNPSQATELFSQRMLGEVLQLFDADNPSQNVLVSAALQVVTSYAHKCIQQPVQILASNDDSQEYGSWDEFDVMDVDDQAETDPRTNELAYLLNEVRPWLRRFLSNIFGSDTVPDHAILKNAADCWYHVAHALVRVKARSWDDFVGQFSTDSWESMRHTQQSQQYKVYFLAKAVDSDYGFYERNRVNILGLWINALSRPSYYLCWEHLLTSIILFHDDDNELLFNPPFVVRTDAGSRVEIPMSELRERRTAMIYMVLRNVHRVMAMPFTSPKTQLPCSKADVSNMLKGIESTMKTCYLELEADSQAQKEYRVFINFVVQQMQLYAVDFHKIDPFFMDPAISLAEEYAITAALKRYGLTIETTGITKAMVLFLYNASERAAVNDKQENFTLQLCNAWLDLSQDAIERTENHGSDQALLILSLENVFPAYIGHSFSEPGYIVAGPLLRVLTHVYQNLRCRPDFWNPSSCHDLIAATELILRGAVDALFGCQSANLSSCSHRLSNFNELVTFVHTAMLRVYEAAQAFPADAEYSNVIEILLLLKNYILTVERPSDIDSDLFDIEADPEVIAASVPERSTIGAYADKELQNALDNTWRRSLSGGWEIIGRGAPKVVKASRRALSGHAADMEREHCKQRTKFVVREFLEAFVSLDWWE